MKPKLIQCKNSVRGVLNPSLDFLVPGLQRNEDPASEVQTSLALKRDRQH